MATAKKTRPAAKPVKVAGKPHAAPAQKTKALVVKKASAAKKPTREPAATPPAPKAVKTKKPKLVRDSFTIPKTEYVVLDDLKQRAAKLARSVKKSELLRAGIKALAAMPDTAFLTALANVPTIKTGRPTQAA